MSVIKGPIYSWVQNGGGIITKKMQKTTPAVAIAICIAFCLMPMAAATDNANKNTDSSDTNTVQNLQIGMTGEKVTELQKWLKEGNFYNRQIDGYFGIYTEKAVKQFQKSVGLKEDGIVGPVTLEAIKLWKQGKIQATNKKSKENSRNTKNTYKTNKKSTSSKSYRYNSGSYGGYINGMDCWAMSDYLSSKYRRQGYQTRILHAKTSLSNDHRWVQIYQNGRWVNAPDYSSLPWIYKPTG